MYSTDRHFDVLQPGIAPEVAPRRNVSNLAAAAGIACLLVVTFLSVALFDGMNGGVTTTALWNPAGLELPTRPATGAASKPGVVTKSPIVQPAAESFTAPQAGKPILQGAAATAAMMAAPAIAAQAGFTPPATIAEIAASNAWVDPSLVTTFLGGLSLVVFAGLIYKVATEEDGDDVPTAKGAPKAPKKDLNKTTNIGTDKSRQLLGIKGALDDEVPLWKIRLQLTKPVTWVPLIWGVACGAAASGNYHWSPLPLAAEDLAKALTAMFMSGPLLTGYTQTINDWEDREIDAINEPYRPIPSGRITGPQVIAQIWVLLLSGVGVAAGLDYWAGHWGDGVSGIFLGSLQIPPIVANALFGAFVAYIYSAPPLKLKAFGWIGNYALGASYIALPWWCGQSLFGQLNPEVMVLSILYSLAGLGIAIVNDFKSIEGDRALGLVSLPVQFGVNKAKYICAGTIDATQLAVAWYLAYIGETNYAIALFGLVAPQMFFQYKFFLPNPMENDVKYQAAAQPFLVFGILCTALAMGHHQQLYV